jgi:hypothetical protein
LRPAIVAATPYLAGGPTTSPPDPARRSSSAGTPTSVWHVDNFDDVRLYLTTITSGPDGDPELIAVRSNSTERVTRHPTRGTAVP